MRVVLQPSREHLLNILTRQRDGASPQAEATAAALILAIELAADRARHDGCGIRHWSRNTVERHEILELLSQLKLAGMRAAYQKPRWGRQPENQARQIDQRQPS